MHRLISRRRALALTAGLAVALPFAGGAFAQSAGWQRLDAARAVVGDAEPRAGGITLEAPLMSEDGSAVPLTVLVDSPMNGEGHVEELHLFAPANPNPEIAVIRFTPLAGRAEIATRVRLNESQTVLALARLSNGEVLVAEREINVTATGCLMRDDTYASEDVMRTRVRMPDGLSPGTPGEVTTIINHPMETGLRVDDEGEPIPERIIERFSVEFDGETVIDADLHRSVAANPYLRFYIAPPESGELVMRWVEDTGESAEERAELQVS